MSVFDLIPRAKREPEDPRATLTAAAELLRAQSNWLHEMARRGTGEGQRLALAQARAVLSAKWGTP